MDWMPGSSKLKLTIHPYTTVTRRKEKGALCSLSCAASSGTALSNGPAQSLNCTLFTQKTGNGAILQEGQPGIGQLHNVVDFTLHITHLEDWNKPTSSILPFPGRDQYRAWEMEAGSCDRVGKTSTGFYQPFFLPYCLAAVAFYFCCL